MDWLDALIGIGTIAVVIAALLYPVDRADDDHDAGDD